MSEPDRVSVGGPFIAEEGMEGVFTRDEAPGAIPNGARVVKTSTEEGDGTPNGAKGTVLGSLPITDEIRREVQGNLAPGTPESYFAYFIEWDHAPKVAVACMDFKVEEVT